MAQVRVRILEDLTVHAEGYSAITLSTTTIQDLNGCMISANGVTIIDSLLELEGALQHDLIILNSMVKATQRLIKEEKEKEENGKKESDSVQP